MGISDLALGAPRGLFSTQDYNDAISREPQKSRMQILREREEEQERNRVLRDTEGTVCACGVKFHPVIDKEHTQTQTHCEYLREKEGIVCDCGVKYHPKLDGASHRFHAQHISFMASKTTCECGATLQWRWLPSHRLSKKHEEGMRRVKRTHTRVTTAPKRRKCSAAALDSVL